MSTAWLSGGESGGGEAREGLPLVCARCGNRCRLPASSGRTYACPRCGHYFSLPSPGGAAAAPARRALRMRAGARVLLVTGLLLGTAAIAVSVGLSSYRAAGPGWRAVAPHPVVLRLTRAEEQSYAYRLRQLEEDLARDDQDFEVLVRLGELHLQLAECQIQGRNAHLRRARYYLLLAGPRAMFRPDEFQVRALLEAANSSNPAFVMAGMPEDMGPPIREDEAWVRIRIGFHEEQAYYNPRNSRLLRRLGEDYTALYRILDGQGAGNPSRWQDGTAVSTPGEARRRAELYFRRAMECALTREAECRALRSAAELYRAANQPARSALLLGRLVALQPNNWLASAELASLCRQLGQPARAERFRKQAARWRTPGWI